jgi:hypothetical protein
MGLFRFSAIFQRSQTTHVAVVSPILRVGHKFGAGHMAFGERLTARCSVATAFIISTAMAAARLDQTAANQRGLMDR